MDDFRCCNQSNRPIQNDKIVRTRGAIIEDILFNNRGGNVTISYGIMGDFQMIHKQLLVLLVNHND